MIWDALLNCFMNYCASFLNAYLGLITILFVLKFLLKKFNVLFLSNIFD